MSKPTFGRHPMYKWSLHYPAISIHLLDHIITTRDIVDQDEKDDISNHPIILIIIQIQYKIWVMVYGINIRSLEMYRGLPLHTLLLLSTFLTAQYICWEPKAWKLKEQWQITGTSRYSNLLLDIPNCYMRDSGGLTAGLSLEGYVQYRRPTRPHVKPERHAAYDMSLLTRDVRRWLTQPR